MTGVSFHAVCSVRITSLCFHNQFHAGFVTAVFGFLAQCAATFLPWLQVNDVVYNGYLTSFTYSPITLCASSPHPYIPSTCLLWISNDERIARFGRCCDTYTTFRAVQGLMVFAMVISLAAAVMISWATWRRNDLRHMAAVNLVGWVMLLCGLCGTLSIALFFLLRATYAKNWTYVTVLPSSSSSFSAGPVIAGAAVALFWIGSPTLLLWSRLGPHYCSGRVRPRSILAIHVSCAAHYIALEYVLGRRVRLIHCAALLRTVAVPRTPATPCGGG